MIKNNGPLDKTNPSSSSYQRPNDQWQDVVVQTDGTGETQVEVVRKTRSLRWRRWMFTLSITAFTFGALMIGFATPSIRNELVAPGDLCSSHAQILAGQGVDRCAACHPGGDQSFSQWASTAIFGADVDLPTQSGLCMKCHQQSFDSQWAMNAHGVNPDKLRFMTTTDTSPITAQLAGLTRTPSPLYAGEIACNACHREHHGSQNDLTTLTDQQCQVCHQNVYHSFETDHPPLDNYPLKRRSRIAFDHISHSGKHYPDANQSFKCAQCHVTGSQNNVQGLASFEQSCAECHQQKIDVLSEPGLTLLALPTLDMTAIEAQGTNVGSWPLAAIGDFDGTLPPLMRLLLLADSKAKTVLVQKGDQFDFSDLDSAVPQDVADGVTLVWSIKRLVFELARDGRPAISRRIREVTGIELDSETLKAMTSSLEASVFQNSANRWLPDLQTEVSDQVPKYEASLQMRSALARLESKSPQKFVWSDDNTATLAKVLSEFYRQDETLQNQPARENSSWLAINPLAGTASPKNLSDGQPQPPIGNQVAPQPDVSQVDATSDRFVAQQGDRENSQWLAENPLAGKSGSSRTDAHVKPAIQKLPSLNQPSVTNSNANLVPGSSSGSATNPPRTQPAWDQAETVLVGWVRDDLRFQLRYQPTGHSDTTVKSWIDFAGRVPAGQDESAESHRSPLFELLFANEGFGDCRRCHTADQQLNGELVVNWQTEYRDPAVGSFTRFSHGPHLTLPELRDCSTCHQLDPGQRNQATFVGFDSKQCQSNFVALKTSDCASCHQSGGASNRCTQCHNYHVGMRRKDE